MWSLLRCSLAVHPNKVFIASGQTAGVDKDGKVSLEWGNLMLLWSLDHNSHQSLHVTWSRNSWHVACLDHSHSVSCFNVSLSSSLPSISMFITCVSCISFLYNLYMNICLYICPFYNCNGFLMCWVLQYAYFFCVFSHQPLQPFVHIWDSTTLTTLQQIGLGTFERGVGSVAFSSAVHIA